MDIGPEAKIPLRTELENNIFDGLAANLALLELGRTSRCRPGLEPVWKLKGVLRRVFWRWPALARPLQNSAGMRGPRRLGHRQNPLPQAHSQFSGRLLRGRDLMDWQADGGIRLTSDFHYYD